MMIAPQLLPAEKYDESLHRLCGGSVPVVVLGDAVVHVLVEPPKKRSSIRRFPASVTLSIDGIVDTATIVTTENGVGSAVIAVQAGDGTADFCRRWLALRSVRALLVERVGMPPRVYVSIENIHPMAEEVYWQGVGALAVDDLTPEMHRVLGCARVLIVGAMALTRETWELLLHLPSLASSAYRALLVDETLAGDSRFTSIALGYDYVQVSETVSRLLHGATTDVVKNAMRLRYLTGGRRDCAVLSEQFDGWLWCDGSWWRIAKLSGLRSRWKTKRREELFGSAFVLARRLNRLGAAEAVAYAVQVAFSTVE